MRAHTRFSRGRHLLSLSLAAGLVMASRRASATDVQACLNASDKGQRVKAEGKLREARAQFQICTNEGCPTIVRRDCSQWLNDINALMPSVVFGAKDKAGRDLFDVAVSMDGEVLVKKLDGKSVLVDPGPHTFSFQMAGQPLVVERALVKEGEKARAISVSFSGDPVANRPVTPPAGPVAAPPASADEPPPPPPRGGEHSPIPWVVVGVGAAVVITGIVVLATAPSLPEACNSDSKKCERTPGQSDASFQEVQDQAQASESRPVVGGVLLGTGLVVVAGGLLWHFLEPTGPKKTTAWHLSPFTGAAGTGAVVGGTF